MVLAFSGWNDAGSAASSAAEYLDQSWSAAPFATIDAEEFFDFTAIRPSIELTQSGERRISWPSTTFSIAEGALEGRDLILVRGVEPQLKWRAFTETILGVAEDLGASMIVTFGALLADVPHTRPTVVYGSSSGGSAELDDLEPSTYEGPTGIIGVIHSACSVAGIPYASLWAAVPTTFPVRPRPRRRWRFSSGCAIYSAPSLRQTNCSAKAKSTFARSMPMSRKTPRQSSSSPNSNGTTTRIMKHRPNNSLPKSNNSSASAATTKDHTGCRWGVI